MFLTGTITAFTNTANISLWLCYPRCFSVQLVTAEKIMPLKTETR